MLYFGLRLVNSVLTFTWGFLLTAVMIRVFGLDEYSRYVTIAAVGMYLAASDLGISSYVYAKVREGFIRGDYATLKRSATTAISIYLLVAAVVTSIVIPLLWIVMPVGTTGKVAPMLFFIASAFYLPWIILRVLCGATDLYLRFEVIDLVRRIVHVAAITSLLLTPALTTVMIVLNISWIVALVLVISSLRTTLHFRARALFRISAADFQGFVAVFRDGLRPSIVFSLAELLSYSFGYIFVPLTYGAGFPLIIFDLFYKFQRAAIVGNQIAATGMQPRLTRAFHAGDAASVRRSLAIILALSILAMTAMALIIVFFGPLIWKILLHDDAVVVGPAIIASIIVAAYANAIQNTAGNFIVNTGMVHTAQSLALLLLVLITVVSVAVYSLGGGVGAFLLAYGIVYFLGALAWGAKAVKIAFSPSADGQIVGA